MPASRSRTLEWRRTLDELWHKGGALEVAVARDDQQGHDLLWRLRILEVTDTAITVENPGALGRTMPFRTGTQLVAFIVVGQNRWQFDTNVVQEIAPGAIRDARFGALQLAMPESVRRCMRQHARHDVGSLALPPVDLWPLLEPKSVVAAERANELSFAAVQAGAAPEASDEEALLPTVGPKLSAHLANIGGGGAGIVVDSSQAGALNRSRVFWIRIPLGESCPVPIVCTAKLVHTHMDSMHRTYAGLSFDFTFNPGHQKVVAAQVERSIRALEARQQVK